MGRRRRRVLPLQRPVWARLPPAKRAYGLLMSRLARREVQGLQDHGGWPERLRSGPPVVGLSDEAYTPRMQPCGTCEFWQVPANDRCPNCGRPSPIGVALPGLRRLGPRGLLYFGWKHVMVQGGSLIAGLLASMAVFEWTVGFGWPIAGAAVGAVVLGLADLAVQLRGGKEYPKWFINAWTVLAPLGVFLGCTVPHLSKLRALITAEWWVLVVVFMSIAFAGIFAGFLADLASSIMAVERESEAPVIRVVRRWLAQRERVIYGGDSSLEGYQANLLAAKFEIGERLDHAEILKQEAKGPDESERADGLIRSLQVQRWRVFARLFWVQGMRWSNRTVPLSLGLEAMEFSEAQLRLSALSTLRSEGEGIERSWRSLNRMLRDRQPDHDDSDLETFSRRLRQLDLLEELLRTQQHLSVAEGVQPIADAASGALSAAGLNPDDLPSYQDMEDSLAHRRDKLREELTRIEAEDEAVAEIY
jgi:hypothetical protein